MIKKKRTKLGNIERRRGNIFRLRRKITRKMKNDGNATIKKKKK